MRISSLSGNKKIGLHTVIKKYNVSMTQRSLPLPTQRWTHDGYVAYGYFTVYYAFAWRSDGKPHWLRVDVRDGQGRPTLLGHPVYLNGG
jgi:hypothetical protein